MGCHCVGGGLARTCSEGVLGRTAALSHRLCAAPNQGLVVIIHMLLDCPVLNLVCGNSAVWGEDKKKHYLKGGTGDTTTTALQLKGWCSAPQAQRGTRGEVYSWWMGKKPPG